MQHRKKYQVNNVLLHNVGPSAKHLSTPIDMLIVQRQKLENIVDLVQLFGENLTVESSKGHWAHVSSVNIGYIRRINNKFSYHHRENNYRILISQGHMQHVTHWAKSICWSAHNNVS